MSDLARMVDTVFISPVIDINSKMYIAVFGIFLFWFLLRLSYNRQHKPQILLRRFSDILNKPFKFSGLIHFCKLQFASAFFNGFITIVTVNSFVLQIII